MTPKTVIFFWNGNTAVFDSSGRQIPELQEPWLIKFVEFLESNGVDPLQCQFELPGGDAAQLIRTSTGGWNWEVKFSSRHDTPIR